MALTSVDKIKIGKYLRENSLQYLSYVGMYEYLGKKEKTSDSELLEYFAECVSNEFRKSEKVSTKYLVKLIAVTQSFILWVYEAKITVSEDVLDKIRSFPNFYSEYLTRTGYKVDDSIISYLTSIDEVMKKIYPANKDIESISKYINQIAELEKKLSVTKRELTELTKRFDAVSALNDQRLNKNNELQEQNVILGRDLRNRKKEITSLLAQIAELQKNMKTLETQLQSANTQITDLAPYKDKCSDLTSEVKRLTDIIVREELAKQEIQKLEIKRTAIEEVIYKRLLHEDANIDELIKAIAKTGIVTDRQEITSLLRGVRQKINVVTSSFTDQPRYQIVQPLLPTDSVFRVNVPYGCKHVDLMLVADFHIKEFDRKVLAGFDSLNDYCAKEGINLILNLGDFFNGFGTHDLEYGNAIKNYNLIKKGINLIPKSNDTYHAILGGNHDRNISCYGFDPIELLTSERDDFINLGYFHSTIEFTNRINKLGAFDIHHPESFDFSIKLSDDGIDMCGIIELLNDVYARQGRTRDESYFDFVGHTHKSQVNFNSGYYFLPPYFDARVSKGACHLRVYFDEDNEIKYIVLMPLSFVVSKLVKNNEIIYEKVYKK